MSKSIQIVKQSVVEIPGVSSYRLVVTAVNPQGMNGKIFIKQRIRNFAKDTFDDTFVAICTPTQLEDFEEDSPGAGTSYYRTDTIDIVARTPEAIQTVFDSLLYETKKLVDDLDSLDNLAPSTTYNVPSAGPITIIS